MYSPGAKWRWEIEAVEFSGVGPDVLPSTGSHWSLLEFSKAGTKTLTLDVRGNPSDIGKFSHPFLVGTEDHVTNIKVTVYSSDKIYQLVEMIRKMEQDGDPPAGEKFSWPE